ncbi:unnamed protein product [Fusarium equiseti]|uniref:Transposase Tc1-like domain-containing protein n=1 Tax=Fusarium equiseti TaxID=61235 RepID=A0A8J2JDV0_FUSEQ|nr:unnamed protein product [Fusarium equiseti]
MGHDIATRALVVTLKSPQGGGKTTTEIHRITGLSERTINSIYAKAIRRGFEPNESPLRIADEFLQDAARPGRPPKRTTENQDLVITKVSKYRFGREKTAADIAGELSSQGIEISASTVKRILKSAGYRKTKPTRKPGLTAQMHETSVILLHRRGGYRIWRKSDERVLRSCIRERWKGSSEFMFWAAFSYNKKGPCHCWMPETPREKQEATVMIDAINAEIEPLMKEQWELTNGVRRLGLRNLPGKKPA